MFFSFEFFIVIIVLLHCTSESLIGMPLIWLTLDNDPLGLGWLVVFYVLLTARSFRDGTPIYYCPLRKT